MKTPGSSFIHERHPDLHKSREVEDVVAYHRRSGESIPNDPSDKIATYLGFLANSDYVDDGVLTGDQTSIDRQIELASVSLTKDNAEAYVKFQAKVARELGRGGELDPDMLDDHAKMEALRLARTDQQKQLGDWVGELNSTENHYPDWFKYWMFENVKRHAAFNDDLGKNGQPIGFTKRSASSFGLFPELDRESVSLVYDALKEKLSDSPDDAMGFEYAGMRALLAKSQFGKLYAEAQNYGFKITDRLKEITTGSWHDFSQSDKKDDARGLSGLVKSYRTGWCTAGAETAAIQLQSGDFYVWCSSNPDTGSDDVPRIAVRMEDGSVAEIRGIVGGLRQELEPELADIVMAKISNLPGGESYFQKVDDMKHITTIEQKVTADPAVTLSDAELRFLYEMDRTIQGFGYDKDPRIAEIRSLRGTMDHPELVRLLPELIQEQERTSFAAYQEVAAHLGAAPVSEAQFTQLMTDKKAQWQTRGIYDYLVTELIERGSRPNLVLTPNILADYQQVRHLAEQFGKDLPYTAFTYDALYQQYSAAELSGELGDDPLRVSIIPSGYSDQLGRRTVDEQRDILLTLQRDQPTLRYHVPSVLESVSFWFSLRARTGVLANDDIDAAGIATYIRHFNVNERLGGAYGALAVPDSYVFSDGTPGLGLSSVDTHFRARVAVR